MRKNFIGWNIIDNSCKVAAQVIRYGIYQSNVIYLPEISCQGGAFLRNKQDAGPWDNFNGFVILIIAAKIMIASCIHELCCDLMVSFCKLSFKRESGAFIICFRNYNLIVKPYFKGVRHFLPGIFYLNIKYFLCVKYGFA